MRGSLTFIVNNIEATRRYFQATTVDENRSSRRIDVNMNRLPDDVLALVGDERYEIRRAQELYPQYQNIDVGLDIHSTVQAAPPMILQIKGDVDPYINGLPIPIAIDNIAAVQVGIPACSLYGGVERDIPVFEIEAGQHEDVASFRLAIRSALLFLVNTGIIERTEEIEALFEKELVRTHYNVVDSVVFPDDSYELTGDYEMFTPIRAGEVLATGNGAPILSPMDGHAIFAPSKRKPVSIAEEALFLTEPAVQRTVSLS